MVQSTQASKILVAYTTNAGTTVEVAQAVGDELSKCGAQVDVRRLEDVADLAPYSAVVVGAPMIMGWHRAAMAFVKKHEEALSRVPVAYFLTARSLTQTGEAAVDGVPVYADPALAKAPKKATGLSFRERYATVPHYVAPVLQAAPRVRPVSVALFGGKLELYRLKWWQALFVLLIIAAPLGGYFNRPYIREWAAGLGTAFVPGATAAR